MAFDPVPQQGGPLLLLELHLEFNRGNDGRDRHLGRRLAMATKVDTLAAGLLQPRRRLRRRAADGWWCSAARAAARPLWELNSADWTLDQPVRARERPDPAAVPVDGVRQHARQADGVRRPQLGRQPIQAGHLGVVGDGRDADQPDHRRHEAGAAQPGGPGLRQQARPRAAVRRLRDAAATTISGPGSPTTGSGRRSAFTGARPTARYGVWMFYDAARDKVYVLRASTGAATRSGSTTRR